MLLPARLSAQPGLSLGRAVVRNDANTLARLLDAHSLPDIACFYNSRVLPFATLSIAGSPGYIEH